MPGAVSPPVLPDPVLVAEPVWETPPGIAVRGARTHPALNDGHPWDPSAGHKPSWAVIGTLAHPVHGTAPGIQLLSGEHPSVRPSSMCSLHGRNPAHHTQDRGRAAPRKPQCPGVNSLGELGRAASPPLCRLLPCSTCDARLSLPWGICSPISCCVPVWLLGADRAAAPRPPRRVSPGAAGSWQAAFSGWQPLLHHHQTLPRALHDPRARPGMSLAA